MLFIQLVVRDLPAARAFYEALGFRIQEQSSDDQVASVVVDEDIVVALMTRDRFAVHVPGEVGNPAQPPAVVHSLTVERRAEVDDLVGRALAAGGRPWSPARDEESRYTGSFTDPDGHPWEIVWLDQLHVVN